MNLRLAACASRAEARGIASWLERAAADSAGSLQAGPLTAGAVERLLDEHFAARECLLLEAREFDGGAPRGACLTVPFRDPLTQAVLPMIVVLYVEPSLRRLGVARAMVQEAGRLHAHRGSPSIAARAGHNDDALISMGERWGFVRAWELLVREP
jgi:GNAT superfamily N-acetyltransferase